MKGKIRLSVLLSGLFFPFIAAGCPVPVFQYALDYWEADPYHVTVCYHEALSPEEAKALERLKELSRPGGEHANIAVIAADLAESDLPPLPGLKKPSGDGAWMTIHFPDNSHPGEKLWEGPLSLETVGRWADSPLRRETVARLLAKESAVWIFLKSGQRRKDSAAEKLLREELKRLEQTLVLPDQDAWGWDESGESDSEPAGIRFSVLTLDRDDPEEQMLVQMLLRSEPDLDDLADEPMTFPVFGRGRALYALVGKGINAWTISEAAEFLTGACSCQVKALNPGTDLLMAVDWESSVQKSPGALPPPVGLASFSGRLEEAEDLMKARTESSTLAASASREGNVQSPGQAEENRAPAPAVSQEAAGPAPEKDRRFALFSLAGVTVLLLLVLVLRKFSR